MITPTPKPFEKLRAAMVETGYTHETMAMAIGLSYSAFNQKMNCKKTFTLPECLRIVKKLNRTLDQIFLS
jgi:DNA-binding XRE family transcriptional regulator